MGLFSFFRKNKQDGDEEFDVPVKARRSQRKDSADAQEPIDPALPEKKRARRRLTGAIALVLAAIIGLPMIFDSEPRPLPDDIPIVIPPRDKSPEVSHAAPMPLPPHAPPEPAAPVPAPAPAVVADAPLKIAKPEAPSAKPAAREEKVAQAKPAQESAGSKTAREGKESKEASAHFVLQVAAVTTKAKATELQDKLKKAGIKSYSQKIATSSGDRIRVRVGPFNSKEEANKMRARITKLGLSSTLQPA